MTMDPPRGRDLEPATDTSAPEAAWSSEMVPVLPSATVIRGRPSRSSGTMLNALLLVAAIVATGGVAFAFGRGTAPASPIGAAGAGGGGGETGEVGDGAGAAPGGGAGHSGAPGANGGDGFVPGSGVVVSGTVKSISGDTLTVVTPSGRTVVIGLGSGTAYRRASAAGASDVSSGATVDVRLAVGEGQPRPSGAGTIGTASTVIISP